MLPAKRLPAALYAIHMLLVHARAFAAEGMDAKEMFKILDDAELLPALIVNQPEDTTEQFRSMLEGLGERYPAFKGLAINFDKNISWSRRG